MDGVGGCGAAIRPPSGASAGINSFSLPLPNAGVEHGVIIVLNNDGTKLLSHQWQSWCGVELLVYGC
jgi:hypothetical protein